MKRVLITGTGGYIGGNIERWLSAFQEEYYTEKISVRGEAWKEKSFSGYDVMFHAAGIAHADVGDVSEERKRQYYEVNTDLTIALAKKAKAEGVKQFIFMSSMIVYSGCKETHITKETLPVPLNVYGDSKWRADLNVQELNALDYKTVVIRPPMIYGKNSRGNYPHLAKLAAKLPVFPIVKNKRSMLHIDNLCEFVKQAIDGEKSGVFFPQNAEYTATSDMVKMIAEVKGHKICLIPGFDWAIKRMMKLPGKIGGLAAKAFGDFTYDMRMSEYPGMDYQIVHLKESIKRTEG